MKLVNDKVIEIKQLTKKFKDLVAVNQLNLNVMRGDVFGFLGPNGAGKSTTIRMMLSLIKPTEGEIYIFGKELRKHRDELMRKIGAIVEKPDFYGYLTAYKNIEIFGRLSGCNPSKSEIMEVLELVGLRDRYNSKVKTFSHGMKQRLGIAQALLHDPELIILDEPTTGLDPQGMKEVRELILFLSKEKNKTILLSSHILHEVELVANRMIIINHGNEVIEGQVSELLNASRLQVTFEIDNADIARKLLSRHHLSDKINSFTEGRIIMLLEREEIASINKLFNDNSIAVSAVVPTRSLEDYFLRITEGGAK